MNRHRSKFEQRGVLAMRAEAMGLFFEVEEKNPRDFELRGKLAIVSVEGPLTNHPTWFWDSYDAIKSRIAAALESSADTVVLRIDSPGGLVAGCFETARSIRELAAAKGKKLVAYADGMAASAGYALACAASEIYLPATGYVGSIGVINTLHDAVEMHRQIGLNFAVIASGERKRFGNPMVALSESALASAQREVDYLATLFFELVAETRPLDAAAIASLEAGVFIGKEAVSAKLADDVCTFDDLLGRLSGETTAAKLDASNEDNMGWKEALKKAADEGDEDAKKALAALDGDGEDKDDKQESKKAEGESDDKKDDAADDDKQESKKAEGESDDKKEAKVASGLTLAATVQSLVAWKAESEEREERKTLMSSRPDLAAEVVAFLDRQPLAVVRDAVKNLPRGVAKGQVAAARAAIGVGSQAAVPPEGALAQTLPPAQHDEVLAGMGIRPAAATESSVTVLEGGFTQFRFRPNAGNTAAPAEKGKV